MTTVRCYNVYATLYQRSVVRSVLQCSAEYHISFTIIHSVGLIIALLRQCPPFPAFLQWPLLAPVPYLWLSDPPGSTPRTPRQGPAGPPLYAVVCFL